MEEEPKESMYIKEHKFFHFDHIIQCPSAVRNSVMNIVGKIFCPSLIY